MKRTAFLVALLVCSAHLVVADGPCFTGEDYAVRQAKLLAEVSDGVIIVDATATPRDFTYLTGVEDREGSLVLIPEAIAKRSPRPEAWQTTIYLPDKNPNRGTWDDPRLSFGDDTAAAAGIASNAPLNRFSSDVVRLANITDTIYVPFRPARRGGVGPDLELAEKVRKLNPAARIKNLSPVLDRHQWQKAAKDIEIMRHAVNITVDAFMESARLTRPGLYEYEIEALVDFIFRRRGSQRAAFIIVGSGPNSCMLHHMDNDRQMKENELLVLDIGTVYCQIATDLTRTIPVSGKFTEEQRRIYDIVLEANKKAISIVKPGVTLAEIHKTAFDIIDEYGYGEYFIHGTSHTLNGGSSSDPMTDGLLMEGVGQDRYRSSDAPLVPGSMFTIEPGIYIPEKDLGIRIEDDILVTEDGYEVLTKAAPKEAEEIESLMKEALKYLKEPTS